MPCLLGRNDLRRLGCWVVGIDLSNRPDVKGSLDRGFKELKDLEQLSLENTKASGDIAMLLQNTKLDYLNLQNTMVNGNLAALQKAMALQSLNLGNTRVIGDILALKNLTKLKTLYFANTQVSASLDEPFKELKDLEELNLQDTEASGDIAFLRNNPKLKYLNLRNTKVFGDLAALQRATQLKDFNNFEVSNTTITCPQEAALKAVLVKLGFKGQQLEDLHAMEGISWMLSSSGKCFILYQKTGFGYQLFLGICNKIIRRT